jgi:hypothetical protein
MSKALFFGQAFWLDENKKMLEYSRSQNFKKNIDSTDFSDILTELGQGSGALQPNLVSVVRSVPGKVKELVKVIVFKGETNA